MTHKSTTCASTKELCDRTKKIKEEEKIHTGCVWKGQECILHTSYYYSAPEREKMEKKICGRREGESLDNTKEFPSSCVDIISSD